MFELRCTVRKCQEPLTLIEGSLRCAAGHHFDRAREGYWSLLQPQDRKSLNAGDSEAAVLARHRWLGRGHAQGLIQAIEPWIKATGVLEAATPARIVDLGCGEGSFGPALFGANPTGFCGIDLSKRAIKLAARGWPAATWVLSNADRTLPLADSSVQLVTSLFGRRPAAEMARVLAPGGNCIIAVPGENDLIELRASVQQTGLQRSRWEAISEELAAQGLEFVEHKTWCQQVELELDAITDALAMTYRGARHSEQARLAQVRAMRVSLSADLIHFRRK